jgi:hypothetical protein
MRDLPLTARDRVLQTPELLENILSFAGYKTLFAFALRVNKFFNATVTASPCLRKIMFESYTLQPPEESHPFSINVALADTF